MNTPLRLWADFNETYRGRIWTTLRQPGFVEGGKLSRGEPVELWDHEGNRCLAVVDKLEYPILWMKLLQDTWQDAVRIETDRSYRPANLGFHSDFAQHKVA